MFRVIFVNAKIDGRPVFSNHCDLGCQNT